MRGNCRSDQSCWLVSSLQIKKISMRKLTLLVGLLLAFQNWTVGQVPVIISPPPKLFFTDTTGTRPLSFGCVFTYVSGTLTPLQTFTDNTGLVANANPVILNAGGFAGGGSSGIWLQAGQAYTQKVVSNGGVNCASGTTQYVVNGIGGGASNLTTIVPFSATTTFPITAQNQLFQITLTGNSLAQPLTATGVIPPVFLTFQITQDSTGGRTFTWPSNLIGGSNISSASSPNQVVTQEFLWNGVNATALGPATTGSGPNIITNVITSGPINATGSINATGTLVANGLTLGSGGPPRMTTNPTLLASAFATDFNSTGTISEVSPISLDGSSIALWEVCTTSRTVGSGCSTQPIITVGSISRILGVVVVNGQAVSCIAGPVFLTPNDSLFFNVSVAAVGCSPAPANINIMALYTMN